MIHKKPLVSVSVVTYNHKNYIKECLDGILMQQTNFPFEIILGEDESSDGTREICIAYANKYPDKINLFLRSRKDVISINGNPTGRFNFIENLKAANGKYIALCEGDDYWTDPLKLQKQVDFLEANEEYNLCFHPCDFLISKRKVKPYIKTQALDRINYEYTIKNLLINWNIPTASMVFRNFKDELPQWFSEVGSGDIALAMILFNKGKFKLLKEWMSVYRINGLGISSQHVGYKMIHKRVFLYYHLNEYFNYKYEKDIYDALNQIYIEFSNKKELKPIIQKEQSFFKRVLKKIYKKIK